MICKIMFKAKSIVLFYFLVMLMVVAGCNEKPDLGAFDSIAWKNDKKGCEGKRMDLLNDLEAIKNVLQGMNEEEIKAVLGPPDMKEISKRSQKFFYYYLKNGAQCGTTDEKAATYEIRFSALGYANEFVLIRN